MDTIVKTNDRPEKTVEIISAGSIPAASIPLDYAYSNKAAEIDTGIRDTIKGIRFSILAMGIGLARIKKLRLFVDLSLSSMNQYIDKLVSETRMDQSSIFAWLRIGEAYMKYQNDLEEIGFSDNDGPSKLLYINRALETKQKQEVFDNIKDMSVREFKVFARHGTDTEPEKGEKIAWRGNELYIGKKKAITINYAQNSRIYSYFKKVNIEAGLALEEGGVMLPIRVSNSDEANQFYGPIVRLIQRKRAKLNLTTKKQ
jgi:hypothetical protein